jgi:Carboxypeptidase regulatory-like domain
MRRFAYKTALSVFLVLAMGWAPELFAQFETAEVLGTVRDASNAPVPEATVTLTNQQTGIESKMTTNEKRRV